MSDLPAISREALDQRLRSEVENLEGDDLAWWSEHRVEPFPFPRHGLCPFAVAVSGEIVLLYYDDRDTFGRYAPEPWRGGLRFYENLPEAVRYLATSERLGRLLSDTAGQLLEQGFLERGDYRTQRRVLQMLGAIGPDAAVAVPRLIEILGDDRPLGNLQEDAVATLAAIGAAAAPAVPKLVEMAERDTANARGWCLRAFRAIGPAAAPAVPLLIDLLLQRARVDPDPLYVPMAADALGNIGSVEALRALLQVLRETDDADVALEVVTAIGKLGPGAAEAEPTLVALASCEPDASRFREVADLRKAAREALSRIGKPGSADDRRESE